MDVGREGQKCCLPRYVPVIGGSEFAPQQARRGPYCLLHKPGPLADAGYELQRAVPPLVGFRIICTPSQKPVAVKLKRHKSESPSLKALSARTKSKLCGM